MTRAPFPNGAFRTNRGVAGRGGFTLLEMCMVLLIIAILFGVTMPAMQSALVEQNLRTDSHQVALMVRTGMIQCAEQHRNYVMELEGGSVALHPQGEAAKEADDSMFADNTPSSNATAPQDVSMTQMFDSSNKLLVPDPDKADAWIDMPPGTVWTFQPGQLCPATHIRIARGTSWLEMTFSALTGNVDTETTYFP